MADEGETQSVEVLQTDEADSRVDGKSGGLSVPGGMPALLAFGVAVLAAIGVSGGVLVRAVRATPGTFVLVLGALLILAAALEVTGAKSRYRWTLLAPVMLVMFLALVVGASSIDQRDMPAVAMESTQTASTASEPGMVAVIVTASGSGLRPGDNMLVQVQGLKQDLPLDAEGYGKLRPGCVESALRSRDQEQMGSYADRAGDLLIWTQAGPDADGDAEVVGSFDVEVGTFNALCAVAVYNVSRGPWVERAFDSIQDLLGVPTGQEVRSSVSFLQLRSTGS